MLGFALVAALGGFSSGGDTARTYKPAHGIQGPPDSLLVVESRQRGFELSPQSVGLVLHPLSGFKKCSTIVMRVAHGRNDGNYSFGKFAIYTGVTGSQQYLTKEFISKSRYSGVS